MTLDYGNFGIFLIMGNAGFISSTARVMVALNVRIAVTDMVNLGILLACVFGRATLNSLILLLVQLLVPSTSTNASQYMLHENWGRYAQTTKQFSQYCCSEPSELPTK